jgi:hypothetical protein
MGGHLISDGRVVAGQVEVSALKRERFCICAHLTVSNEFPRHCQGGFEPFIGESDTTRQNKSR